MLHINHVIIWLQTGGKSDETSSNADAASAEQQQREENEAALVCSIDNKEACLMCSG